MLGCAQWESLTAESGRLGKCQSCRSELKTQARPSSAFWMEARYLCQTSSKCRNSICLEDRPVNVCCLADWIGPRSDLRSDKRMSDLQQKTQFFGSGMLRVSVWSGRASTWDWTVWGVSSLILAPVTATHPSIIDSLLISTWGLAFSFHKKEWAEGINYCSSPRVGF